MKRTLEDARLIDADTMLDGDELIDLGKMSEETRGLSPGGTEGPDCMPWKFGNCP
ncbi:MAG: hypothetical protein SXG53_24095 [Pseudomonadota bacterium]|nr:hypothetical protein [Pseudomonadota bacterium]